MALQVGSRLGHYKVTALIGEGGMGPNVTTPSRGNAMKSTTLRLVGSALVALCWVPAAMAQTTESPPVQFTRAYDAGGLLPSSARQYAAIEEARLMQLLTEFIDISRRYRDAGHPQFWGRIMGTESDVESAEWMMDKYRQAGLTDVRRQALELPPQWMPQSWTVTASAGGRSLDVAAVHPTYLSPGTPPDGLDLEAVYVGLGRAPDLAQTPDVRGQGGVLRQRRSDGSHVAHFRRGLPTAQRSRRRRDLRYQHASRQYADPGVPGQQHGAQLRGGS